MLAFETCCLQDTRNENTDGLAEKLQAWDDELDRRGTGHGEAEGSEDSLGMSRVSSWSLANEETGKTVQEVEHSLGRSSSVRPSHPKVIGFQPILETDGLPGFHEAGTLADEPLTLGVTGHSEQE